MAIMISIAQLWDKDKFVGQFKIKKIAFFSRIYKI